MTEYDEGAILKPRHTDLEDEDEWPEFSLTHVQVHDQSSGELRSLLDADGSCQLTVTGRLAQLPAHLRHHQVEYTTLPATVTISDVVRFAYGQQEDGQAEFWAAGKAGWFKIAPARAYRQFYKSMVEAIIIFYFVSDLYQESQSRKSNQIPVQEIFTQYTKQPDTNCRSNKHAAMRFRTHRKFLLSSMLKEEDGVNWKATPVYAFLKRELSPTEDCPDNTDTDDNSDVTKSQVNVKGRSVLRPRTGKTSNKSAGKRFKYTVIEDDRIDDHTDSHAAPGKRRKGSPSRNMGARKHETSFEDSERRFSGAELDPTAAGESELPLQKPSSKVVDRMTEPVVRIVEDKLPPYEPTGPGNTWTCDFDGCSHVIYGALSDEAKALIREHYRSHAFESQAKLDLLRQEERPYLPVSNLLKRVREVAEQHFNLQ